MELQPGGRGSTPVEHRLEDTRITPQECDPEASEVLVDYIEDTHNPSSGERSTMMRPVKRRW